MEIMTKEEYFKNLATIALIWLDNRERRFAAFMESGTPDSFVLSDFSTWFETDGDELTNIANRQLDEAYDEYVKSNEKDHIFDVKFHYTVSGKAQVHAKDEDEAEEYVNDELYIDGANVYFSDDSRVVEDVEAEVDGCGGYDGIEIDYIDDTGDEFDED